MPNPTATGTSVAALARARSREGLGQAARSPVVPATETA
jgi:hypothetical protein